MHKYNLDNLKPFKSKWQNKPTKLIRIPERLEKEILAYAYQLDNDINPSQSLVTEKIKEISIKIDNKEKGYKSNSASQLIKDIQQLINEVN
ncbi:hypothetical protein WEU38_18215 (plasmid) [Cyanobacterium aponinum AL20118]|uniref:Uncharacterized protein n=1 Tax=Cyanobacterium aponinum AL20115 TaxID=3090662 RepID=A0AAF1C6B2_9CHRO|nr:hypothetical protein [Cyanobacterium aponinum]WPF90506.1 hypothetical protein SAY89_18300 [Cyanobacterium aponinum AL20115]